MRILPCGDKAFLVELDGVDDVIAHHAGLAAARIDGVVELVPAARTILVQVDTGVASLSAVADRVRQVAPLGKVLTSDAAVVEVPVRYTGPDLADVAALLGVTPAEVVRWHGDQVWTAAFTGFAPGFAYLVAGVEPREVPRRATPRTSVPAGSVALAGPFAGVYPRESPGGWQVIGTTSLLMWDVAREQPALLGAGSLVRFVDVT